MIRHLELAACAFGRSRCLYQLIRLGKVALAGNKKLKIYGTLHCSSGKRMHIQSRVFFPDAADAEAAGYRPCGHCCPAAYRKWKTHKNKTLGEASAHEPPAL